MMGVKGAGCMSGQRGTPQPTMKRFNRGSIFLAISKRSYQQNKNKAKRTNYLLDQLLRNKGNTVKQKP